MESKNEELRNNLKAEYEKMKQELNEEERKKIQNVQINDVHMKGMIPGNLRRASHFTGFIKSLLVALK